MAQRVKSLATKFHPKYSHGRRAPTPASCPDFYTRTVAESLSTQINKYKKNFDISLPVPFC